MLSDILESVSMNKRFELIMAEDQAPIAALTNPLSILSKSNGQLVYYEIMRKLHINK